MTATSIITRDKKNKDHKKMLESMMVLDFGKNTATLYDPKTDTCNVITHEEVLKLSEKLPSGKLIICEAAHLAVPRSIKSLSQPFTAAQLLGLYNSLELKGVTLRFVSGQSTPRAISASGLPKSDKDDPKSIYRLLYKHREILDSLMIPRKSFEVTDIVKLGWDWKDFTNQILNIARRYGYQDNNSEYIIRNIQPIYDNLSPAAREVFGLELFKKTSKIGKPGTVNIKKIKNRMVQMNSILSIFRDDEGNLRLLPDTGNLPNNYFIKRYVLCMTPNHRKGGVSRSNLYFHGMRNFIIKMAKIEDSTVNLKRKVSLVDQYGETYERTASRGHFTDYEDSLFLKYRKQYCRSIFELINIFKQLLIS